MPELSAAREEGDHVTYAKELTQLQKDHSRLGSDAHKILSRAFGNNFLELEEKDVHSLVMDLLNQSSDERTKNTLNRLATSFNEMVEKNELAHTVLPLELDNFSRHSAKGERKAKNGHRTNHQYHNKVRTRDHHPQDLYNRQMKRMLEPEIVLLQVMEKERRERGIRQMVQLMAVHPARVREQLPVYLPSLNISTVNCELKKISVL
mgnify:CR=1 FL=1